MNLESAGEAVSTMTVKDFEQHEISQNYRVLGKLGAGGCSVVYDARRLSDNRRAAIKVLSLPSTLDASEADLTRRRFIREARVIASLHEPHIVECLDFGAFKGDPCLVLEYIEGRALDVYLKEFGGVPFECAVGIICQMLGALEESHGKGVIHRDIKPTNVMVISDSEPPEIRLLDFGIATLLDSTQGNDVMLTQVGSIRGTPSYMAPELFRGRSGRRWKAICTPWVLYFWSV